MRHGNYHDPFDTRYHSDHRFRYSTPPPHPHSQQLHYGFPPNTPFSSHHTHSNYPQPTHRTPHSAINSHSPPDNQRLYYIDTALQSCLSLMSCAIPARRDLARIMEDLTKSSTTSSSSRRSPSSYMHARGGPTYLSESDRHMLDSKGFHFMEQHGHSLIQKLEKLFSVIGGAAQMACIMQRVDRSRQPWLEDLVGCVLSALDPYQKLLRQPGHATRSSSSSPYGHGHGHGPYAAAGSPGGGRGGGGEYVIPAMRVSGTTWISLVETVLNMKKYQMLVDFLLALRREESLGLRRIPGEVVEMTRRDWD